MTSFDREDILVQLFDVLRIDERRADWGADPDQGAVEDLIETRADIAADSSLAGFALPTPGARRLIASLGSGRRDETDLKPMAQGRFTGAADLSEPHAELSLGDVKTRAASSWIRKGSDEPAAANRGCAIDDFTRERPR